MVLLRPCYKIHLAYVFIHRRAFRHDVGECVIHLVASDGLVVVLFWREMRWVIVLALLVAARDFRNWRCVRRILANFSRDSQGAVQG